MCFKAKMKLLTKHTFLQITKLLNKAPKRHCLLEYMLWTRHRTARWTLMGWPAPFYPPVVGLLYYYFM